MGPSRANSDSKIEKSTFLIWDMLEVCMHFLAPWWVFMVKWWPIRAFVTIFGLFLALFLAKNSPFWAYFGVRLWPEIWKNSIFQFFVFNPCISFLWVSIHNKDEKEVIGPTSRHPRTPPLPIFASKSPSYGPIEGPFWLQNPKIEIFDLEHVRSLHAFLATWRVFMLKLWQLRAFVTIFIYFIGYFWPKIAHFWPIPTWYSRDL